MNLIKKIKLWMFGETCDDALKELVPKSGFNVALGFPQDGRRQFRALVCEYSFTEVQISLFIRQVAQWADQNGYDVKNVTPPGTKTITHSCWRTGRVMTVENLRGDMFELEFTKL